jgi:HEAT repeat protein
VPDLIAIAGDTGESEHVREAAMVALGQIGRAAAPAVPVLQEALGENRVEVWRSVLSALAGIATPEAVAALVELLEHGQAEEQRAVLTAFWAQGVKAKSAAAELLAVAARHPDDELSDRIFLTVATLGPDAAAELAPYLQADRLETRHRAILALSRLGPDAVVAAPGLSELLKDESVLVRFWAAKVLGNIGPKARQATASLLQLLADGDPNVRWEAMTAIAKIDPAAFTEVHWSRLLADSDPGVRQRAATIRFASL